MRQLKLLIGICLLRAKPQDLEMSQAGMLAAIAAYGISDVIGVLDVLTLPKAMLAAAVDTLLLVVATRLALQARGQGNRVTQTLTALAGCGALLSLLAWSIAGGFRELLQPGWVWAVFLLWYTLVFGHVVRHALSIPLAAGVGVGLFYILLSISVTGLFVGPVPTAVN